MNEKLLRSIEFKLSIIRALALQGVIIFLLHNAQKEGRDTRLLEMAGVTNLLAIIIHNVKEIYRLCSQSKK